MDNIEFPPMEENGLYNVDEIEARIETYENEKLSDETRLRAALQLTSKAKLGLKILHDFKKSHMLVMRMINPNAG